MSNWYIYILHKWIFSYNFIVTWLNTHGGIWIWKITISICRSLKRLSFCPKNYGNYGKILIKSDRDFCKSRIQLLKFMILGAAEVFDGVESISTIKNMIQTLLLQDFLKFFCLNSDDFWPFEKFLRFNILLLYILLPKKVIINLDASKNI